VSEPAKRPRTAPAPSDLTPALYRAAVALGRTRDAAEVVRVAIAETQRATRLETVALYVLDPARGELVLRAFAGTAPGSQGGMHALPLAEATPAVRGAGPPDVVTIPVAEHPAASLRAAFAAHGFRHVTIVPIRGQDQALGVLYLATRQHRPPSAEESTLLQALGGLVGVALENAALRERLIAQQERLRALTGGTLRAREEEARRIAHELHDEAGQILAAVHISLDELVQAVPGQRDLLQRLHDELDRVEAQLRRLSRELRPTMMDDLGLGAALGWLAQGVTERTGVAITVDAPDSRLSPEAETALYRIVQEALANAVRHARPRRITVEVRAEATRVRARIHDDGQGFDVAAALARRGDRGLGLIGMRERAEALGGTLEVRSAPHEGTEVCVAIPRDVGP
jgi:signal transduction histidine kinase